LLPLAFFESQLLLWSPLLLASVPLLAPLLLLTSLLLGFSPVLGSCYCRRPLMFQLSLVLLSVLLMVLQLLFFLVLLSVDVPAIAIFSAIA
jgi:hypothetical protein